MAYSRYTYISLLSVAVVVVSLLAWYVMEWMMSPFYVPGCVRSEESLSAPLEPPFDEVESIAQREGNRTLWQFKVTREVTIYGWSSASYRSEVEEVEHGQGRRSRVVGLVVHGGPCVPPLKPWKSLTMLEEMYGDQYVFVYYHQRGCGNSWRPHFNFSNSSYLDNLSLLRQNLGLPEHIADIERIRRILVKKRILITETGDHFVLIGHSFGGMMSALYAAEFGVVVNKIVLVSPALLIVFPPQGDGDIFLKIRQRLEEISSDVVLQFDKWRSEYLDFSPQFFQHSEESLVQLHSQFLHFYTLAINKKARDLTSERQNIGGWMPFACFLSMGRKHDYSHALREHTVADVLIIHGESDLQSLEITKNYQNSYNSSQSRFVVIPNSTHFAFAEAPERFSEVLHNFLTNRNNDENNVPTTP